MQTYANDDIKFTKSFGVSFKRCVDRNLLRGDKRGGLGDGSPLAASRGRAPVGVWGEAPRSQRKMLISSYDRGTCTHAPPWLRHWPL